MSAQTPHRGKKKATNPILTAIEAWLSSTLSGNPEDAGVDGELAAALLENAPKRWTAYSPMVLLPSGSFTSPAWTEVLKQATEAQKETLWADVLERISRKSGEVFTHLAANEGIPLQTSRPDAPDHEPSKVSHTAEENILRSPSGLKMLYGGFGPSESTAGSREVTELDFEKALWVTTKQNGIHQTWAPRWTMFSRGNIKEKARLLAFHDQPGSAESQNDLRHRVRSKSSLKGQWAVDLYGGIGYFVFSYVKLGLRVLCWEINPWSVEGLRRGAIRNGWPVKVVKDKDLERPVSELISGDDAIIVFQEDNQEARRRMHEMGRSGQALDICHVNCGLLPRSDGSWRSAWDIINESNDGWLHLHENVGVHDIQQRRQEIQEVFNTWNTEEAGERSVVFEHVELVKTFAPDVWHCVFDVYIKSSRNEVT